MAGALNFSEETKVRIHPMLPSGTSASHAHTTVLQMQGAY